MGPSELEEVVVPLPHWHACVSELALEGAKGISMGPYLL
jgi:hypothetical protein